MDGLAGVTWLYGALWGPAAGAPVVLEAGAVEDVAVRRRAGPLVAVGTAVHGRRHAVGEIRDPLQGDPQHLLQAGDVVTHSRSAPLGPGRARPRRSRRSRCTRAGRTGRRYTLPSIT